MTTKKTLVIVDHPTYDRSNANRRLVEEMRKYPDDILIQICRAHILQEL